MHPKTVLPIEPNFLGINVTVQRDGSGRNWFKRKAFIQENAAEVFRKIPNPVRALQRFCDTLYSCWQFRHTALSAAFYSLHTAVGNSTMNKLGTCCQWCNEYFKVRTVLFSVDNGAMNTPRYWQQRNIILHDIGNGAMNFSAIWQRCNELLHDIRKCTMIPVAIVRPVQIQYTGCSTQRMGNLSSAFERQKYRLLRQCDEFSFPR